MQAPNKTSGNDQSAADSEQALRQRAEKVAGTRVAPSPESLQALSPDDIRHTLHELQVHQIELEMQNEELRRAQLQLDTARARYFDLYDLAPVGYCTISEPGLILEANLAAATLLGMSRGKLVRQRFSRFILKSQQDSFYLYREQILASDEAQRCELQMVTSDGTPLWVALQATAENDAGGVCLLRVVMSDITARRQASEALRESDERYRSLFNLMDEGFCIIEKVDGNAHQPLDFRYLEANPAFTEHSGVSDVVGKTIRQAFPDEPEEWFVTYNNVHTTGVPTRFERGLLANGRVLELYAFRIGEPDRPKVAVIFKNITERVKAEAEREFQDSSLQAENVDLEREKIAAEKANRAKSDFLSSMSHELRTPLNAILGFAQLMESGTPTPTPAQKRSVDQILQAGWYLLALINEILDLALVESGTLSLSQEPLLLGPVLQECRALVEPQAQRSSIALNFPALGLPYCVSANHLRMKQILVNLLSNAIKYNRVGGSVNVTCTGISPERVRISVEDTGEGLSQEDIRHIFEPFNRLGREALTEEGTGIGLVMAKRLVELMGGIIGVDSTPGKGSAFWIEMDLTTERPAFQAAPPTPAPTPTEANAPVRTLLYVEDNRANLALVEILMERRPDLRLLSARDGTSGVEVARAALPDVILMDINLPDISGIEALKILRKSRATAHIPVLALSADAMPHHVREGLDAGFFRYLTKPIRIDTFMSALDDALALAKAESIRAAQEGPLP